MKKLIALILTFVFLFSMASCHKNEAEITSSTQTASTAVATETISESFTETESETMSVTRFSKSETTKKRSASAASTTKKKKPTSASILKTTVTKIAETISTTAKRKKKPTTRRNYFPETSSAVFTTLTTTETSSAVTTKAETQTTETETEEEEEIPVYRPVQRPASTTAPKKNVCTISINCAEILKNENKLKSSKKAFVPSDGVILKTVTVEFEEGDTVFDILCRVCKSQTCYDDCRYCKADGIQLEYEYTPGYENYYVEGIHQIYEKDCGSKSGWMYKVNGVFPNYGCSEYALKDSDKIEFIYTCELGKDIGAEL